MSWPINPPHRVLAIAIAVTVLALATGIPPLRAQNASDQQIATQLANPVAAQISVPFQFNWDHEFGPAREGHKFYLNFQPVVPIGINPDWMVISRTIAPIVDQHIGFLGDGSQSGVADITQSFFLSPTRPTAEGIVWGVGPAILIPTHADFLSADKWGLGPTAVVLKQQHGWTVGVLANHLWSVGGSGSQDISNTFLEPFLSYTTKDAWTFTIETESTYDWMQSQWTVPINAAVAKVMRFGNVPVSLGVGVRYYADSPSTGPHGWGARLLVTFVFPK